MIKLANVNQKIKDRWWHAGWGAYYDASKFRRKIVRRVYARVMHVLYFIDPREDILALICKIFDHKIECEGGDPENGSEDFYCKRCGRSWRVWH